MSRMQKLVMMSLLLVAALAMFVIGTDAAYHTGFLFTGNIKTAEFNLIAIDNLTSTQTFADLNMEPNQDYTRTVKIDTSGCKVDKMDVYLTLNLATSGTVPSGFSVLLDGQRIEGTTKTIQYADAQSSILMPVITFNWTLSEGEDAQQYEDFSFSYTVDVEGRQTK